ncbi:hypothetical protein [Gallaecimonas sp. GXIMD1310]|uniref:hypothetical protein n=1 Tax=Gallaecimonas sp. GXIMD1310 TaxID=3131926 RepID=UPI00324A3213
MNDTFDEQALRQLVENQINDADPAIVKETLMRLTMTGTPRDEAITLIACALSLEVAAVVEEGTPFNHSRYRRHLQTLPETPWLEA